MRNKPLAITYKPFKPMKKNTSKKRNFYTQGQQYVGGMLLLFIVCLFTSCNTGSTSDTSQSEQQGSKPPLVEQPRSLASNPQIDQQPEKLSELAGGPTEHGEATVRPGASISTPDQARVEEQQESKPPLVEQFRALASNPQIDQQPGKLAELGGVLLELAKSKQAAGASRQDLSLYTDAAILYQHVLSISAQKADTLGSQEASSLAQSAYQGLAQIQASMLARATGAAPITVEAVKARINADKQRLEMIRTKAREEAERLAVFRDKQGTAEEVRGAEAIYIEGSRKLFADIAEEIKSVLGNFYQAGEQALGPPPCKYAIMGVGSIALQQTTPYSDLEFAILMEDAPDEATAESWKAYFRKLTHLVHFRVINLGETVLPFSEYKISLDHLGRKGLNFDLGGKTPLGRKDKDYELIQPVAGMMEYLKNEDNKIEQMDKLLPFVLERTCYIYGDQKLHNDYLAAQKAFWSSCQDAAGKHAYQERMRKVLLEGITELDHSQKGEVKAGRKQEGNLRTVGPKLHPEDAGRLYDVKQEIYRLPDRLLYGLAMYFGICPKSGWDAVEQLQAQGIIGVSDSAKHASHRLQYAVSFATMLRLATYIRYGQQKEDLAGSASRADIKQTLSELFALPKEALQENGSLFKYYYTALALHSEMEEFFELLDLRLQIQTNRTLCRSFTSFRAGGKYAAGQEKSYFCSSGFYDASCAAKIAIYNRLLHYEEAAKCAERHLEAVKQGYDQKKLARYHHNLGVSYYHLGRFDQSFDHFERSLELLEGLYPVGDPQAASVLRSLGTAHYNLSEFQESLEYFERSLKMLQGLYQEKNPETAQALASVGAAHEQLDNFQESLQYKQQALEMLQGLYPDKDPEVARALLSLGESYALDEKLKESFKHKQEALEMFKELCGKSHPEVARALLSLGDADAALKNFEASEQHKEASLSIFQDLYGSSHPEVARALLSVGEMYALSGKLKESEHLKEQSWKMFQAFYREDHPEVVRALGSLNETRGRLTQGEASSRQATGPALRPVRTVYPQHLALLPTPRHGKEAAGENTLLRDYYQDDTFACVPSLFDEQRSKHVKDLECQLMLREKKLVGQDKKEALGVREDQVASHHMRLEEVKTPIALQDLFKARSVRPDKPIQAVERILLTGDPGTGKTTVSRRLAYQWAAGDWGQEFAAVYLLPIRNLQQDRYNDDNYRKLNTLATAIVNNCFNSPNKEEAYTRLRDHIEEELKKPTTLVILDGLDERAGASEEILRQAQDQSAPHKLLMLSRPYGVDTERQTVDIEIEHVGFNRAQLQGYVRQEVSSSELAASLLSYIDKHANIRLIAHVPVNLAILCALWQDASCGAGRKELEQGSLPVLYRLLTEYTWRRYKERGQEGVSQGREALFSKLGQIALAALEQGEVLISPGLIEQALSNSETDADEVKARCKDAGFLLLRSIDQKFYQFPHLTFQEYFAGCTLAGKFLSRDEDERAEASDFVSEHKYESQYGRTLTFMAGEVSRRPKGVKGIKELLNLLEKEKEIVGVQHLRLQLRVVHEWLCVAPKREVERGMSVLKDELKLGSCLGHWFDKAFAHIRREGYAADSTGEKLLQLLVSSLQTFGSVPVHAPDLLKPLKQAAQDYNVHVRRSALKSLGQLVSSSPSHVPAMRDILLGAAQDRDADYVRPVGLEALGQAVAAAPGEVQTILGRLARTAQKGDAYDRPGALAALGQVVAASPDDLEVPEPLLEAAQDANEAVRQAAVSALGQVATAPDKTPALLETLHKAAEDTSSWSVRQAAVAALGQAVAVVPHEAPVILKTLYKAAKDQDWPVRQAAVSALGQVVAAALDQALVILETLYKAAKDTSSWSVRQAVASALGQVVAAAPREAPAILEQLYQAAKDSDKDVRAAAVKSLGKVVETTPSHALAMLETLLAALQDEHDDVRQAAMSALGQVAASAPDKAPAIADVRQVALHKISLQELLEQYFAGPSTNLIPHITARLCHTPLVVCKGPREGYQRLLLYATTGDPEKQDHSSDVVGDFVGWIASSASQTDQKFPCKVGKEEWERYFGAVGSEPQLPSDISEIMDSACPFWPGNKVRDTHMLVLIPDQVAGNPLTLDYFGELVKSPQGGGHKTQYRGAWYAEIVSPAIGSKVSDSSYWVLMTRDVLPGSRWKSYQDQCALVADHAKRTGLSYEVPGALESAVVMLLHYVRSGERLYSDNPWTYTRCRENVGGHQLAVGGISSRGLLVSLYGRFDNGVSALRKF